MIHKHRLFIALVVFLGLSSSTRAQDKTPVEAPVKVVVKDYYCPFDPGKKTFRKAKQSNTVIKKSFDSRGNILETSYYARHKQTGLRMLSRVEKHYYNDSGSRYMTREWENDQDNGLVQDFYAKYIYDATGHLEKKQLFTAAKDSLFKTTRYEYDRRGNLRKRSGNNIYIYEHDSLNRRVTTTQLWQKNGLWLTNWVRYYNYNDTVVNIRLDSYNGDSVVDYSKQKIITLSDGRMVHLTDFYLDSSENVINITTLEYDKKGMVKRINYYRQAPGEKGFRLIAYSTYKVKTEVLPRPAADRINRELITVDRDN